MDASTTPQGQARSIGSRRTQKLLHFRLREDDVALLSQLSDNHQAALLSQGSYRDRAEALGVALGTVRSRLHRARTELEKLRQKRDMVDPSGGS